MLRAGDLTALEQELIDAGIILDRRTDHRHAFAASDALITDAGSFLIEYLSTGKPMAYLRNPDGPGLTEEAEHLAGQIDVAIDPTGAISFIELARGDRYGDKHHRERMREDFLPMQDGRASARILDCIASAAAASGSRHEPVDMTSYPTLVALFNNLRAASEADRTANPLGVEAFAAPTEA